MCGGGGILKVLAPVVGGALAGPVGAGIGGALGGASDGGGLKGALLGGGLGYGGASLLGGAGADGLASAGGSAMGEGALGSGLSIGSGASGIGGGALGTGITPGIASSGIGGGALGSGIGSAAGGSLGALGNLSFSPQALAALQTGGSATPTVGGGNVAGGLNASAGASSATPGNAAQGLRVPGAAPGPAAAGNPVAGTAGAGATGGAAGGAGTQSVSFVDSIIKQMKDNALGLGLITATSLAGAGQRAPMPNQEQIQGLGDQAAGVSRQLINQYQSGQISSSQQASIDQLTQGSKNQINQYFASIGQSDSTAHAQALAAIDKEAVAMKQQMLDTALNQGLNAIGVASGPLNTIANYQLGQDQRLQQAFGNFAGAIGNAFGRQAGTPAPVTATPQPTGVPA